MTELAKLVEVDTPMMNMVIDLTSAVLNKDFRTGKKFREIRYHRVWIYKS